MPVYFGNCSMKKFNKIKCFSYVFTVILALGFVLTACEKPVVTLTTPESVNGFKLNTYVQIDSYTSVSKNTLTEALNLCDYYENIFSRTKEDSELSKVNSNQTTSISKEMYELVSAGLEYAALSNGAFDITRGSVSRLWDFTAESPKVPDSGRIAEALTHVDYTRVSVSDNGDGTYSISKPDDVILDLGAVAKGYIADKIKDFLEENGVKRGIINLGGNVLCIGKKTNTDNFGIGVRKPFAANNEVLVALSVDDSSVVSSGNYERYFYADDGTFYHHILNPATGYSYDNDLSDVTILSKDSLTGDCLSTTCFCLGLDDGMKLIESLDGIEAVFVTNEGEIHYSSGAKSYVKS